MQTMKPQGRFWVISEKSEYSALGYFLMIMRDAYKEDKIQIKSNHYNLHYLSVVEVLLKLAGWRVIGEPVMEAVRKSACGKCTKVFEGEINKCPVCKGDCNSYVIKNEVHTLERHGALQAYVEEVLKEENTRDCLLYLESQKNTQKLKDMIMSKRW